MEEIYDVQSLYNYVDEHHDDISILNSLPVPEDMTAKDFIEILGKFTSSPFLQEMYVKCTADWDPDEFVNRGCHSIRQLEELIDEGDSDAIAETFLRDLVKNNAKRDLVKYCVDNDVVDVNITDDDNYSMNAAMLMALYDYDPDTIRHVVDHGLDLSHCTSTGDTLLHFLVRNYYRYEDLIYDLIETGEDVNGHTAMWWARVTSTLNDAADIFIVETLMEAGAEEVPDI